MTAAYLKYSPSTYASILIAKHGLQRAYRIANDRETRAESESSAAFYSQVMVVIDRKIMGGVP
jgi:hypothetical protein